MNLAGGSMGEALMSRELTEEASSRQYVTFSLNDEDYAIEALKVQEILELTSVTKVPHLPDYFRGVINLRGVIIPVVDMKVKFGMSSTEYGKHTCVIVTEISEGVMGMVVDSVSDVMYMPEGSVSDTPKFGDRVDTEFIKGMGRSGEKLIIILDIDRVLSESEKIYIDEVKHLTEDALNTAKENGKEVETKQNGGKK